MGDTELAGEVDALQVDPHHPVPPLFLGVYDRLVAVFPENTGVVVEDMKPTKVGDPILHHALDIRLGRDISRRRERLTSVATNRINRRKSSIVIDVGHDHPGTVFGKEQGRGLPLPHTGSSNQCNLARQSWSEHGVSSDLLKVPGAFPVGNRTVIRVRLMGSGKEVVRNDLLTKDLAGDIALPKT